MRALIQRVNDASVTIKNQVKSNIGKGLLVFLGIEEEDNQEDIRWLSNKISQLRIFEDAQGQMNLSVNGVDGEIMVISQFTLHAKTKKGTRPSYSRAAKPDTAIPLYEQFIGQMEKDTGKEVKSGEFGAYMQIKLENDGPVTIMIDTKNKNL
ncbi:MAG: D-aminoacyl-tRNA deacylase [Bacteroidales bacterium]